jgi:hypothetical protein
MVLFVHNTPFRPQRVEPKNRYRRQEKHRNCVDFG